MTTIMRLLAEPSPTADSSPGPAHVTMPSGLAITIIVCSLIFLTAWLYDRRKN